MKKADVFGKDVAQKIALLAVAPIEGRYSDVSDDLDEYFSEFALMQYRLRVEVSWLIFILENVKDLPALNGYQIRQKYSSNHTPPYNVDSVITEAIMNIYESFDLDSAVRVKKIEAKTKHDVKAIEYYINEKLDVLNLGYLKSLVHIGLTSEDVNNTAYALMIREFIDFVWAEEAAELVKVLKETSNDLISVPMLGKTHGQAASPVTVGKSFAVYINRLQHIFKNINHIDIKAKFNGATGCYSALAVAFPDEDWMRLTKLFIESLENIKFNPVTEQIESHDYMIDIFDQIRHFNNIICNIDTDMWMYISREVFKQIPVAGEVGSSTMPQKINPISFENSEGTSWVANGLLQAFSNKLVFTRWQRDLSDSTVQRYIGEAFGLSLLVIRNLLKGLKRCAVNEEFLAEELNNNWAVLAEPLQTMGRKYGDPNAYERLKDMTRGKKVTEDDIRNYISSLGFLSDEDKETLMELTPDTYTGYAERITRSVELIWS